MYYYSPDSKEILSAEEIKRRHPNISFPVGFSGSALIRLGYHKIYQDEKSKPIADYTKNFQLTTPELIDGRYFERWHAVDASTEEIQLRTENCSKSVRADRNQRLADSDWTQVPDAVNAGISIDAWASYRQQLRDVTAQPGFPWEVIWPEQPEPVGGVICDYKAFYDALLISPAYATIRSKAVQSSSVLTACVEFIAAIGDAKSGRPNVPAIQACVDLLCAAAQFTAEELQALADVMQVGKLDQVYTLPAQ